MEWGQAQVRAREEGRDKGGELLGLLTLNPRTPKPSRAVNPKPSQTPNLEGGGTGEDQHLT